MKRNFLPWGMVNLLTVFFISYNFTPHVNAQNIDSNGSYPSCGDWDGTILGSNGWIYSSWEWNYIEKVTSIQEITDMNNAFIKRGSNLIMVPVPNRPVKYSKFVNPAKYPQVKFSQAEYINGWNAQINEARSVGLKTVDLISTLINYSPNERGETFYYPRDHHWTTSGSEASSKVVASLIKQIISEKGLNIKPQYSVLKVFRSGYNSGSFGDYYTSKCKIPTAHMDAYKATNEFPSDSLFSIKKTYVGIFGDSFGLTSPDNNFSTFVEHYSGLKTVNFSVPGIGPLGSLVGYLADPKINNQLPSFVVVPMLGFLPNDPVKYRQITAEVAGCAKSNQNILAVFNLRAGRYEIPLKPQKDWGMVKIHTDSETEKINLEIKYTDRTSEQINLGRIYTNYYNGNKTDFYITSKKGKKILEISVMSEAKPISTGSIKICNIEE